MGDVLFDLDFPYSCFDFDSDSDSNSNSCDDEFGLVQLFGDKKPDMELPPSGSPKAYSWSDDDSGCDDEDITVPVEKSDGFGVCNTYRMVISDKTGLDFKMFSQVAVEEYNRRFKDANSELEFVKVLMALSQLCAFIMLYLTFEAKDLADGGTIKIYQAVVWWMVDDVKKVQAIMGMNGFGKVTNAYARSRTPS
ncbi:hypothetical protein RHMOL_Rhmol08G0144100 [Rhododendron molle]|uniref:Uncharacterized protein n=2 Tax=Rhododendron molle TaxID=49168 RepID=A0ACC0MNK9_RHOML|nr:hypothetical protein RHMOL_Rhmol08G0144100 [Rhododendron molle]